MTNGGQDHGRDQLPRTLPTPSDNGDGFPSDFQCKVCLGLLCKPVVLGCGHPFCIWCLFGAMNGKHPTPFGTPHVCPVCRHEYWHLPSVCQLFSGMLEKAFPLQYEERLQEIQEEETRNGWTSPDSSSSFEKQACTGSSNQLSVAHVSCVSCKQLLVQPIILNCGHGYCLSCLDPTDGCLKCQFCLSSHPGQLLNVCLPMDKFLKEEFSKEYSIRVDQLGLKLINNQNEKTIGKDEQRKEEVGTYSTLGTPNEGVGCDSCGMFPIIGKWYRCIDCTVQMGYDVCERCYKSKSKHPGRFNQHHTPEHRLKLVEVDKIVQLY